MKFWFKIFFMRYFEAIGLALCLYELLCIFKDPNQISNSFKLIVFGIIPILISISDILRRLFHSIYPIKDTDSKISLSFGNILKKKGIVVIHVNREFDTIIGNGVILPTSLHGEFINKFYKNDIGTLDALIDNQLQGIPSEERTEKQKGKRKTYPLGTCVKIERKGRTYILAALTRFDDNCHAEPIDKFIRNEFLSKVWEWIRVNVEPGDIHFPLIGTGCSRMTGTTLEKYRAIVDSGLAAISQSKLYQSFDITLLANLFQEYEDFNEYIRFRAEYKEMSNPDQVNLGTGMN